MNKEKQIELLEKQLAFWKHHCTSLVEELTKEEEIANRYSRLLDETEEELNAERMKNEANQKQSEGEWLEQVRVSKEGKPLLRHYKCNLCGVYLATQANFCPNCGAKMKGGEG